jgi:hypothetical protein
MRTIYEVTVNGTPVFNGEDLTKAQTCRDYWIARVGAKRVKFISVPVPAAKASGKAVRS